MNVDIRKFALAATCLIAVLGCRASIPMGPQPPAPQGLSTKIGNGTVVFYHTTDGPTMMICTDIVPNSSSSGGSSGGPPWINKAEGFVSTQDGRKLSWLLEQRGGQKMKCQLNEKEVDLEKGRLFLVKTKDGQTNIEQLNQDLSGVTADEQSLKAFAVKHPTIAKLLEIAEE